MTGLDLESFLLLLRADLSVWLILLHAALGLAFLVWASWSSRRALRNCLVLSLAAHVAFVMFGSAFPGLLRGLSPDRRPLKERSHIREIRVAALVEPANRTAPESLRANGTTKPTDALTAKAPGPRWDLVDGPIPLFDAHLQVGRPRALELDEQKREIKLAEGAPAAPAMATPRGRELTPAARCGGAQACRRAEIDHGSAAGWGTTAGGHRRGRGSG